MNNVIWNQLLSVTDQLNDPQQTQENKIKLLITQLESIEVAHERSFDPAENFEEYVAVSLCQSIKKTLDK